MNKRILGWAGGIAAVAVAAFLLPYAAGAAATGARAQAASVPVTAPAVPVAAGSRRIVLAGGCFWGMEGVFEALRGVSSVVAGYAGGSQASAHYEIVSTGLTGHAESVEVTYDPARITFAQLLQVYFRVAHDPTELDRQGPDSGPQYRSEIFYTTAEQKSEALATIAKLAAAKTFRDPIVTKVAALQAFYPAEEHHQHFMDRNPDYPYIVYNDKPKVDALKKQFPELVISRTGR